MWYLDPFAYRFRLAAFAPSLPSAVRVFFGRLAIVRLRLAACAAFLMFRRAAALCFDEAMLLSVNHARINSLPPVIQRPVSHPPGGR